MQIPRASTTASLVDLAEIHGKKNEKHLECFSFSGVFSDPIAAAQISPERTMRRQRRLIVWCHRLCVRRSFRLAWEGQGVTFLPTAWDRQHLPSALDPRIFALGKNLSLGAWNSGGEAEPPHRFSGLQGSENSWSSPPLLVAPLPY